MSDEDKMLEWRAASTTEKLLEPGKPLQKQRVHRALLDFYRDGYEAAVAALEGAREAPVAATCEGPAPGFDVDGNLKGARGREG